MRRHGTSLGRVGTFGGDDGLRLGKIGDGVVALALCAFTRGVGGVGGAVGNGNAAPLPDEGVSGLAPLSQYRQQFAAEVGAGAAPALRD